MANGEYTYSEFRVCLRDPKITKLWFYVDADQNCPHMIQGWKYKEFETQVPTLKLLEQVLLGEHGDIILWEPKVPDRNDYMHWNRNGTYRVDRKNGSTEFGPKLAMYDLLPTPAWEKGKLNGELVVNAQLSTRDGRKIGNARITAVGETIDIITDYGNGLKLSREEVEELFYPTFAVMREEVVKSGSILELRKDRNFKGIIVDIIQKDETTLYHVVLPGSGAYQMTLEQLREQFII